MAVGALPDVDARLCVADFGARAASSAAIDSARRDAAAPPATSSSSCATEVALAIGAVIAGRAISQASATWPGVAPMRRATRVERVQDAQAARVQVLLVVLAPRALLRASAAVRYLPVRKPAASA